MSLLTALRTGLHFSKATLSLTHGAMFILRHCEKHPDVCCASHTQCVIQKSSSEFQLLFPSPTYGYCETRRGEARRGENVTEIICISVKRSGLFIGTEEGEITAWLPEALPSGRVNSEPKSGKGSDVVCFSTRLKCDEERLGSETNILRKTSFWVKGQTSLSKNKGHTHADIHLTFTTWPVIATLIKNSPWCLLSFGKFELLAKMCVSMELEMCVR